MAVRREGFTIVAGPEFERVARRLASIDIELKKRFVQDLKDGAKPAIELAQRNVRAMPVKGTSGSTGLRRRVARGVGSRATFTGGNPGIRVTTRMDKPSEAIIPRGLDRQRGWRHPVYGNREVWVRQPGGSWFREAMTAARQPTERNIAESLRWARDRIAEAGGRI